MTNITKIGSTIATVAILASSMMPLAYADTTITVTGNGANSANGVVTNNTQNTSVSQSNTANFDNNIGGSANTGDNTAEKNTTGDVSIKTGDATVNATVDNSANQNYAVQGCCAQGGDTTIKVAGNGADSDNAVEHNVSSNNSISQNNNANFDNDVKNLKAKTGNNDGDKNTGGNVGIETGDASVTVAISNMANSNSAMIGGGNSSDNSVSLKILNNGANTDNSIKVGLTSNAAVNQDNNADFNNDVEGSASTGDNDADKNTGGETSVETGDASVDVTVDNMANFNWAALDCGCTVGGDLSVLVDGNGYKSDNAVEGNFDSTQTVGQDNNANFDNDVKHLDSKSGNNDVNENTGYNGSDPSVQTGDAEVGTDVSNSANLNSLGGDQPEWPSFDMGGVHVSLNFDLSDLIHALGL